MCAGFERVSHPRVHALADKNVPTHNASVVEQRPQPLEGVTLAVCQTLLHVDGGVLVHGVGAPDGARASAPGLHAE